MIILFFIFSAFFVSGTPAIAQDALQCSPDDVRINRNLHVINGNNIFLENLSGDSGKLYIGANTATPSYGRSGSDLLINSPASILLRSNSDFLFQNTAGNRLAGIYASNPSLAATNNGRYLITDGTIEGWTINAMGNAAGSGLCTTGGCIYSWPTSCTGAQKLTASGSTFSCSDDVDTDTVCSTSGACNQLCIGTSCYNSWATAISSNGGGVSSVNNGPGISVSSTTGNVTVNNTGVTRLIAGSGVTLSSETGDVTINADGGGGGGGPCAAGFTRAGAWCLDTDGQNTLLRNAASATDAQYVPVATISGAKAVLVQALAYAPWRQNAVYACVIPGDQAVTSACNTDRNPAGDITLGARAAGDDSDDLDVNTVTVKTDGSGNILTKCTGGGSCKWYLAGYTESDAGGGGGGGWTLNGSNLYPSDNNWNVGIGKTNPGYKLDVAGSINALAFCLNGACFNKIQYFNAGEDIYPAFVCNIWPASSADNCPGADDNLEYQCSSTDDFICKDTMGINDGDWGCFPGTEHAVRNVRCIASGTLSNN